MRGSCVSNAPPAGRGLASTARPCWALMNEQKARTEPMVPPSCGCRSPASGGDEQDPPIPQADDGQSGLGGDRRPERRATTATLAESAKDIPIATRVLVTHATARPR